MSCDDSGGYAVISGFGRPFGVTGGDDGSLYVADMDLHAIVRLLPDGRSCEWLVDDAWSARQSVGAGRSARAAPRAPLRYNGPHSVALSSSGDVTITTYYTPGIHVVGPQGTRLFGTDMLRGPATAHFDHSGRLIVAEYALHSMVAFDADGVFLGALGGGKYRFQGSAACRSGVGPGFFDRPHMCRAMPDGTLIVADTWNHRLQKFFAHGDYLGALGGAQLRWQLEDKAPAPGAEGGAFKAPVAVSIDSEGCILVTDWGNNRLQLFDADGRLLRELSDFGLDRPYDAQFLTPPVLGRNVAIADSHHGRVLLVDLIL